MKRRRYNKPDLQDGMQWCITVTRYDDGVTSAILTGSEDKDAIAEALYELSQTYGYDVTKHYLIKLREQIEQKRILVTIADILKDL